MEKFDGLSAAVLNQMGAQITAMSEVLRSQTVSRLPFLVRKSGDLAITGEEQFEVPDMERDMTPEQRISLLFSLPPVIPVRYLTVETGKSQDPFGLLEQVDTYEAKAKGIFELCEDVHRKYLANSPQRSRKKPRPPIEDLPPVEIGKFLTYRLRRLSDGHDVSYMLFEQNDEPDDAGFTLLSGPLGTTLVEEKSRLSETISDADYYKMLYSAELWVRDYAYQLGKSSPIANQRLVDRALENVTKAQLAQPALVQISANSSVTIRSGKEPTSINSARDHAPVYRSHRWLVRALAAGALTPTLLVNTISFTENNAVLDKAGVATSQDSDPNTQLIDSVRVPMLGVMDNVRSALSHAAITFVEVPKH